MDTQLESQKKSLLETAIFLRSSGDQPPLARTLLDLGEINRRLNDVQNGVKHCEESAAIFRELNDRHGLARALRLLGEIERRLPDPDASIKHYKESIAIYRDLDHPLELAHTARHLGDIYSEMNQQVKAEPYFTEALELYRNHGKDQPLQCANAIRSCAIFKQGAGKINEAIHLWTEAHDLYEKLKIFEGVAECAGHLALLNKEHGNIEQSREWFAKASEAAQTSNEPETLKFIRDVKISIEK